MMRVWIAITAATLFSQAAIADTYVNGYGRRDGTYVAPHYQTAPNNNPFDNYSTRGNINPYTGQAGTVNPYVTPSAPTTPYGGQQRTPCYGLNCR
ncbi:hypothetical protein [Azospirillum cavernae]|uniref:hypothetical protein n=1 Tax=Azospirillum cavernae TaxID=2320860 RepID=UPI0018F666FB|nr:hypothetical protein [Azospirillum cavernae]